MDAEPHSHAKCEEAGDQASWLCIPKSQQHGRHSHCTPGCAPTQPLVQGTPQCASLFPAGGGKPRQPSSSITVTSGKDDENNTTHFEPDALKSRVTALNSPLSHRVWGDSLRASERSPNYLTEPASHSSVLINVLVLERGQRGRGAAAWLFPAAADTELPASPEAPFKQTHYRSISFHKHSVPKDKEEVGERTEIGLGGLCNLPKPATAQAAAC